MRYDPTDLSVVLGSLAGDRVFEPARDGTSIFADGIRVVSINPDFPFQ